MDYWLFLLLCLAATFSPGPAVLLVVKNAANYGVNYSLSGILGNITAMLCLASLSAAGLGAIILASTLMFTAIKVVGGIYLIYLGLKSWLASRTLSLSNDAPPQLDTISRKKLFREAYIVGVSNPKAIAFYTALFPQFIHHDQAMPEQFLLLGGTFALCSFSALLVYALTSKQLSPYLRKQNVSRLFHRITGGVFVGFGLSLLLSPHKS
ncbi:LysE family translocator [Agarivorans sp. QJM3NY_25]|uniref:LysE family translocator n=1 Tax=Agarivorans sp. QJM3NY_25 TaxID=3421430 RepID=UPI003D7E7D3F